MLTAVLLVASVTVIPAFDAFADHDNGNGKSKDKKDKKEKKDPGKRCEPNPHGKYKKNKHCNSD